jgi:hypothetical protein
MQDETDNNEELNDKLDNERRKFLKTMGAATGAAAGVATGITSGLINEAHADTYKEMADRYIPPGQWLHHLDIEWWEFPSDDLETIEVWGYTDKLSYAPGEEVAFHMTTSAPTFDIKIYRDGAELVEVHSAKTITGKRSPTPKDCYAVGCGWPTLYQWKLPSDLRSGFYLVVFSVLKDGKKIEQEAGFTVRATTPKSPILFMLATSTWMAYNDWAGGSYYGKPGGGLGIPTEGAMEEIGIAPRLHIHRPWARGFMRLPNNAPRFATARPRAMGEQSGFPNFDWAMANGYSKWCSGAGWAQFERHQAIWAEKHGYEMDYITQHDLEANPDILKGYKCLLTSGHDEYYSWNMRDSIDKWMEAGGNFARLAGNLNWQIRIEDEGMVQVAYKDFAKDDPVVKDPARKHLRTDMWEHPDVGRPAATTFACSSAFGHLLGVGAAVPRTPGFTVYQPEHWMLEETDLYFGDAFGQLACCWECDGLPVTMRDMRIYPTDEFGTPTNIEIVALVPATNGEEDHSHTERFFAGGGYLASVPKALYNTDNPTEEQIKKHRNGNGVVAFMRKGNGSIATAGVIEWPYALGRDEFVDQITHNVLRRFTA